MSTHLRDQQVNPWENACVARPKFRYRKERGGSWSLRWSYRKRLFHLAYGDVTEKS